MPGNSFPKPGQLRRASPICFVAGGASALRRRASVLRESAWGWMIARGVVRLEIIYVTDPVDWVLSWVGRQVAENLPAGYKLRLETTGGDYRRRVVHFASQFTYFLGRAYAQVHPSNRQVVAWFHGQPCDDNPEIQATIRAVPEGSSYANKIVTATRVGEENLLSWGVEPHKIVRIPLGVNTGWFRPPSATQRRQVREELAIPESAVCIGSFQKDGVGWGEGNEPKLIKGPDIFLQAVARLAEHHPLFVLLTGPARGYVRQGLERLGIPYHHDYLGNYLDIVRYYHALDLYLITSRDEGGPQALLEAMATGVPVVTTRVGMCSDIIENGRNGFLVVPGDEEGIVLAARQALDSPAVKDSIRQAALQDVQAYDWKQIAEQYYRLVYGPLLNQL